VYLNSLTDGEWLIIEPLLPKKKLTRPPTWSKSLSKHPKKTMIHNLNMTDTEYIELLN
jgi:transposase